MTKSLSQKVGDSVMLLFFRKIWGNLINLFVMMVLARVLSKEDFGVLAVSAVLLTIINTVTTSGLSDYIVAYDKDQFTQNLKSVFWLNFILTITVCVIVLISAPFWAKFYDNALIAHIVYLLLITFFFEMLSMVPRTMLRKELQYSVIVRYSTVFMTAVSLGKVMCAFGGLGVYSLVLPQAVFTPILAFSFFLRTKFNPGYTLDLSNYKDILNYSKHIIASRVLSKVVNEGDNLIIGKILGLEVLGIYAMAFQLANLVTTNIMFVVNDIVLPVLAKVKNDIEKLRRVFLQILNFLSVIAFPLVLLVGLFAEPIILMIYGEKWISAIRPLQILTLFALGRSFNSPSSILFNAVGRPDIGFKLLTLITPVFLLSVYFGSFYGIIGVAIATTCVRFAGQILSTHLAFSVIDIHHRAFYKQTFIFFVSGLLVALLFNLVFTYIILLDDKRLYLLFAPLFLVSYLFLIRVFLPNPLKLSLEFISAQKMFKTFSPFLYRIFGFVNNAKTY